MACPPGGCTIGHAVLGDVIAEIRGRGDAIAQVILFQRFLQADGNGLQIAPGQSAVGGIALGQNQQVLLLLRRALSSLVQRKPPMLAMPSFFADMVQPSPSANISCAICLGVLSA